MSLVAVEPVEITVVITEDSGRVVTVLVGFAGPQGPPGTLIEAAEDGVVVVTPLKDLDFRSGFDVSEPTSRTAQIDLDLSEVAAGGELDGTLDAPTIDALHSGSTHQSILDEIEAHEIDVVGAHEGTAVAFTPGHGLVSADVQSAIEELADAATGAVVDGTPAETAHTTDTSRWSGKAGSGHKVIAWDEDTGRPTWTYLTAIDVFEPASILGLSAAPVGSYPNGSTGVAMVAGSGTDTPRLSASYQGTPTAASVDIASHTYGGGRSPEVSGSDYPTFLSSPFATVDGPAINRGRAVGESVTFRESATVDGTPQERDATLTYVNERLWGVSAVLVDTAGEIDTFRTAQSKELSNARARTLSVTASVGEFIYYILRSALGTPIFTVGGFEGGFALIGTVSWTNPRGFVEDYDVWRSDNSGLGTTTVVVT